MDNKKQQEKELIAAFVGNPNCGKTTLFNAYTGAKLKVANWPGVTVEKKEGSMKFHGRDLRLVDLPGIYSLTSYTMEEKLSRSYILEDEVDVIIDVVDASCLERNLYLALQLIELGKPVVLALNMMDIVEERGIRIDIELFAKKLGIPVIPVSARKRTGLDQLMKAAVEAAKHKMKASVSYSDYIEAKIQQAQHELESIYPEIINPRWHAIKLLEHDQEIMEKYDIPWMKSHKDSLETEIINEKYDEIDDLVNKVMVNRNKKVEMTDRADRILTNQYLGVPIFLGIMALVFFLTFTVGDFLKQYFEIGIEWTSNGILHGLEAIGANEILISLIVDGIIAGVGGILTFLPNIFILFLALAFLEDSGYMSRVAYVMDGVMGKIGLSGRAFIPMLLGFGCSVPAIMASRALEDMDDRRRTILVTPFMSCSARLPIYVLFSQVFFPKCAALVAFAMYVLGIVVAIVTSLFLSRSNKKKETHTLLIELPEYKIPNARTIFIYVWEKVKDYLTKAGTTIFIASIVVWALLNYGIHGLTQDMSQSFGASIGRVLVPVLTPVGLGMWQVVVALISGIAAKEVVVSSFSVLFGITNINSAAGMAGLAAVLGTNGFGAANALALMTFCLLYTPCAATIGVMRRELNSRKWTALAVGYQILIAWIVSGLVYQIALRII